MEVSLVQLSSYEDSLNQFRKWLTDTQAKLKVDSEVKASLPEKKMQLQGHKAQHQDIISHLNVLDSLSERAQSLHSARQSPRLSRRSGDVGQQYRQLCKASEKMLRSFETQVAEHQNYQDLYQQCQEQIAGLRDKVNSVADASGDKFAIQSKLDALHDAQTQLVECEGKLDDLSALCDQTLANTSLAGKESLKRDQSALQEQCKAVAADAEDAEEGLQRAVQQWAVFDESHNALQQWLLQMEQQMKDTELKSSLDEKQEQVNKFKVLSLEVVSLGSTFKLIVHVSICRLWVMRSTPRKLKWIISPTLHRLCPKPAKT